MAKKPVFESYWSGWIETKIFVSLGGPAQGKIVEILQDEARAFGRIGVWFEDTDTANSRFVFGIQGPADAVLAFVKSKEVAS